MKGTIMAVQSDTRQRDSRSWNEIGNQITEHSLASLLNSLHLPDRNSAASSLVQVDQPDFTNSRNGVSMGNNNGSVLNGWNRVSSWNGPSDLGSDPQTHANSRAAQTLGKPVDPSTSGSFPVSKGSILLNGGLGSLDRWEGLKEWHRQHKELLNERGAGDKNEGNSQPKHEENTNLPHFTPTANRSTPDPISSVSFKLNTGLRSDDSDAPQMPVHRHDLSIIPEGDEDSKHKDDSMQEKRVATLLPSSVNKISQDGNILKITGQHYKTENDKFTKQIQITNMHQNEKTENKVCKRPFLRKGQGLIRYKLAPEDVKVPYKKGMKNTLVSNSTSKKELLHPIRPCTSSGIQTARNSSCSKPGLQQRKATESLGVPVQRLVLTVPSRNIMNKPSTSGTWSQVLSKESVDEGISDKHIDSEHEKEKDKLLFKTPHFKESLQSKDFKHPILHERLLSPKQNLHPSSKHSSSPEEDQESLAAYMDLEQHVGNASFCSTSSKVDRLVTQSSKSNLHASNPDSISMSQPLLPVKSLRSTVNHENGHLNVATNQVNMWTTTELEDLIKSRARRPKSFGKEVREVRKCIPLTAKIGENFDDCSPWQEELNANKPPANCVNSSGSVETVLDTVVVKQVNKPHLMKTMPGIDLNSSWIQNALLDHNDASHAPASDMDSSSETASELDYEGISDGERNQKAAKSVSSKEANGKSIKNSGNNADSNRFPADLITVDGINQQIDAHLAHLRKEIETLQSANNKSQRSVLGLEKKVKELEQRLALEAHSSERRVAQERDAAAKAMADERAKFSKEKQALERNLRELRKKASDPISQQELMRLKQEVVQWEEKWRADRAKSRGLESNLRIQITNLKRENEKLKEENNKLRREKETAINAEKAKTASNTRLINTIAQKLGKAKPQVSVIREKITSQPATSKTSSGSPSSLTGSAYNLKPDHKGKTNPQEPKPVATIGTFPKLCTSGNEWSSDDEIDLGKETEDEDEDRAESRNRCSLPNMDENAQEVRDQIPTVSDGQAPDGADISDTALEEARNKYEALFGPSSHNTDRYLEDMELGYTNSTDSSKPLPPNDDEKNGNFIKTTQHPDGRIEQVERNGTRVVTHPDGTWERYSASGSIMTVPPNNWPILISYFNGDKLEKMEDGTVKYYYAKTKTWHTTFADGNEEVQFASGQVERHHCDGTVQVLFPGASTSTSTTQDSSEVCSYPEGMSVERAANGDTIIHLANGERELHTKEFMRKDFLDGTVKFIYKDGSQETCYPSGRIRVKDAQGNLIKDTAFSSAS